MVTMTSQRKPEESCVDYIQRICANKESFGTWMAVAEIINRELGYSYSESYYRKHFKKGIGFESTVSESASPELTEHELFRLKKQVQDQRREYRKELTRSARCEHLLGVMASTAQNLGMQRTAMLNPCPDTVSTNVEACLFLADWHYGMVAKTPWNTYNTTVCRERVSKLVGKTLTYLNHHKPSVLNAVILGDMANGGIHCSSRVASEELVCEQLMHVAELLAEVMESLSEAVPTIRVYTCYGNHMRTIQDKHDSIHADNMERLLPWWLQWRLKSRTNIEIIETDAEFNVLDVCGYSVGCVHGDLDSLKNVGVTLNTLLSRKTGKSIDYTVSADKHHLEELETTGIENIIVRSLCGVDDYAHGRRLYSNPGQTLMFFTPEDGRQCTYNIKL